MSYELLKLGPEGGMGIDFGGAIVRDLRYQPLTAGGEIVEEMVRFALQGTQAEIEAWLQTASQVVSRVTRMEDDPVRQPSYLACRPPDGVTWRSPVGSARLEVLPLEAVRKGAVRVDTPLERPRGVTHGQVCLTRRNYWESGDVLPVVDIEAFRNGCTEGQPPNHLAIHADLATGSLPAPLGFQITNTGSAAVGDLWLGIDSRIESPQAYHLECEDMGYWGAGVSLASRTDFSGTAGLNYSGSPGAEVRIGVYALSGDDLAYGYNRAYRALLLASNISAGLEGWVQLVHDGVPLARGPVTALHNGVSDLGVLTIPPWPYDPGGAFTPESVDLELWTYQEDGTPTAAFDAVKLLPVDGGSLLLADLGGGLPAGEIIEYQDGRLISYPSGRAIEGAYYASHHPRGDGLWLHPGEHARLHLVWARSGGFDARDSLSISLNYRRRQSWI